MILNRIISPTNRNTLVRCIKEAEFLIILHDIMLVPLFDH